MRQMQSDYGGTRGRGEISEWSRLRRRVIARVQARRLSSKYDAFQTAQRVEVVENDV